jgi:hypothetical protein
VGIPVGEDEYVPRQQLDLVLAQHAAITAAFGQDVVRDEVLCIGQDTGRELPGGYGLDAEWPRRLDREEVRAIEADDTQQVRERVHRPGIVPSRGLIVDSVA